jgi:hypothetical protein
MAGNGKRSYRPQALADLPCFMHVICRVQKANCGNTLEQILDAYERADLISFVSTREGFPLTIIEGAGNRPRGIGARLNHLIQQYLASGIIDLERIKKKHSY